MRKVNNFLFLPCVCGLRIKLPPEFKKDHVNCPKCKRQLTVPVAQLAAVAAVGEAITDQAAAGTAPAAAKKRGARSQAPLEVTRRGKGWMSFKCTCGKAHNLSPTCKAKHATCRNCGRKINIRYADA